MINRMSRFSFYFRTPIPVSKQLEIVEWVNNLSEQDHDLLRELIRDTRRETEYFAYQEQGGS